MSAPEVARVRSTNVRRSMLTRVTALVGLSTPLAGQGSALTAGLAYTVGGGWQVEGLDFGVARAVHAGPIAALSLTARIGSFIDEGAIIGGARGFIFGTSLPARPPTATISPLGADTSRGQIGLGFTVQTTRYVGSPPPPSGGLPAGAAPGAPRRA